MLNRHNTDLYRLRCDGRGHDQGASWTQNLIEPERIIGQRPATRARPGAARALRHPRRSPTIWPPRGPARSSCSASNPRLCRRSCRRSGANWTRTTWSSASWPACPSASSSRSLGVRKIVRAMPNTPGQIGKGMTVWTATDGVDETAGSRRRPSSVRWAKSCTWETRVISTWQRR